MLTSSDIKRVINNGDLIIDPFDEKYLNPNSYNVRLDSTLLRIIANDYNDNQAFIDIKKSCTRVKIDINNGFILQPGNLYLGSTIEYTNNKNVIPMINGRSSLARLGLVVHQTGGFGDIGFSGKWTLELTCTIPIKVYTGLQIAQLCWFYPDGIVIKTYDGKYQGDLQVSVSKIHEDITKEELK